MLDDQLRQFHGLQWPRPGKLTPISIEEVHTAALGLPDVFMYVAGTNWLADDAGRDPGPGALAAQDELFEGPRGVMQGGSAVRVL